MLLTSTSQSQCCVCRLDSSHYIEHFACVDFTEFLFLPYSFNWTGLGLGLIVFGLGLTRHVWSRSRSRSQSLWSGSQVSVSLCCGLVNKPGYANSNQTSQYWFISRKRLSGIQIKAVEVLRNNLWSIIYQKFTFFQFLWICTPNSNGTSSYGFTLHKKPPGIQIK